ncbi:MAG: cupin domain-containing protein [Tissierellia bacterium]|nr:cupin domain-containing protein [Tissierellia bacterium]
MTAKFSGRKIRVMRKNLGMSIKELAEKSQLSTGLISQIERDMVSPSVNAMARIVAALDTSMGEFFDEDFTKESPVLIQKDTHKIIDWDEAQRQYVMMSPTDNRQVELALVRLKKTISPEEIPSRSHEGEECGYCLSGTLTVVVEDKEYTLHPGDSIYFESTKPHKYLNYEDELSESLWAMTPPSY